MHILVLFLFLQCVCSQDVDHVQLHTSEDLYAEPSALNDPQIYYMSAHTNISNRFATTLITCRIRNPSVDSKEAFFSVTLPDRAFISGFTMEINNRTYKSLIKEKGEAQKKYNYAVQHGQAAAQVKVNARDSKQFSVNINLEAEGRAVFYLQYEDFLVRKLGKYEHVLNIYPGQIVKNMDIRVNINEKQPVNLINRPIFRRSAKINDRQVNASAKVERFTRSAMIRYNPDVYEQRSVARNMATREKYGLAGQFVVQYDVDRNASGGDVVESREHFAHFFVPKQLPVFPKYVVFVLDTSFSMTGLKLEQLKQAMTKILDGLHPNDTFNLIEFNSLAKVWDLDQGAVTFTEGETDDFGEAVQNPVMPPPYRATKENIKSAKSILNLIIEFGATDIYSALLLGCKVAKRNKPTDDSQTIIIFLTDGDTTVGLLKYSEIINRITSFNNKTAPIYTLSLGEDPNKDFLEEMSLSNDGKTKHIYEDDDISLQLTNFFKDLSTPLLRDIKFNVGPGVKETTETGFSSAYRDSELVVVGEKVKNANLSPQIDIRANSADGPVSLKPSIEKATQSMKRLWAYLKVRQLLEQRKIAKNKTVLTEKALQLALENSFVTDVTSLVVVKPNSEEIFGSKDDDLQTLIDNVFSSQTITEKPQSIDMLIDSIFESPAFMPTAQKEEDAIPANAFVSPYNSTYLDKLDALTKIRKRMPWLDNMLLNNGTIVPAKGPTIQIQLHSRTGNTCQIQEPNGTQFVGSCKALIDCEHMLFKITDLGILIGKSCTFPDRLIGVCCRPK